MHSYLVSESGKLVFSRDNPYDRLVDLKSSALDMYK